MADVFSYGTTGGHLVKPTSEGNYNPSLDGPQPNGFLTVVPWGSGNNQLRHLTGIAGELTPSTADLMSQEPLTMENLLNLNQDGLVGQLGPLGYYGLNTTPQQVTLLDQTLYPWQPSYATYDPTAFMMKYIQETLSNTTENVINIIGGGGGGGAEYLPGFGIGITDNTIWFRGFNGDALVGTPYYDGGWGPKFNVLYDDLAIELNGSNELALDLNNTGDGIDIAADGDGLKVDVRYDDDTIVSVSRTLEVDPTAFLVVCT